MNVQLDNVVDGERTKELKAHFDKPCGRHCACDGLKGVELARDYVAIEWETPCASLVSCSAGDMREGTKRSRKGLFERSDENSGMVVTSLLEQDPGSKIGNVEEEKLRLLCLAWLAWVCGCDLKLRSPS
jgi:hypothetical protein